MTRRVTIAEAGQVVTLPAWSDNDPRRRDGAAASAKRLTTKLALAVRAHWRAAG
jgi:hypothetical protein